MLLDVMWQLDTMDKVHQFIRTLPATDAQDAHSLLKIAIWETIELEDGLDAYTDTARTAINTARGL
jgi:hypothetical protein